MLTCKIDSQGRVMLPANWRRRFKVQPSTTLTITEDETGALIVETHEQGVRRAQRLVAAYLKPEQRPMSEELLEDRLREAASE